MAHKQNLYLRKIAKIQHSKEYRYNKFKNSSENLARKEALKKKRQNEEFQKHSAKLKDEQLKYQEEINMKYKRHEDPIKVTLIITIV